jgi:hypothetical protein
MQEAAVSETSWNTPLFATPKLANANDHSSFRHKLKMAADPQRAAYTGAYEHVLHNHRSF